MTILDQSVGEGSVCVHGAPIVAAGGAPPRAHLWLVYWASEVDRGLLDSCGSLLDESERRHSSRLGRPDDRQQYAAAHALLRIALSSQADAAPRDWRFRPGRHGKPEIASPVSASHLRFNLSHTRGLATCIVVAGLEAGVDVEEMRSDVDLWDTAAQFMTAEEMAACQEMPSDVRRTKLYEYWTLKEAYLKGSCLGLAMSPMAVAFRFDEQYDIRASFAPLVCDSSEEWQFLLLDPLATHRLAVAIRRRGGLDIEIVKHVLSPEDLARGGQEMPPERPRCDGDVKRTG